MTDKDWKKNLAEWGGRVEEEVRLTFPFISLRNDENNEANFFLDVINGARKGASTHGCWHPSIPMRIRPEMLDASTPFWVRMLAPNFSGSDLTSDSEIRLTLRVLINLAASMALSCSKKS